MTTYDTFTLGTEPGFRYVPTNIDGLDGETSVGCASALTTRGETLYYFAGGASPSIDVNDDILEFTTEGVSQTTEEKKHVRVVAGGGAARLVGEAGDGSGTFSEAAGDAPKFSRLVTAMAMDEDRQEIYFLDDGVLRLMSMGDQKVKTIIGADGDLLEGRSVDPLNLGDARLDKPVGLAAGAPDSKKVFFADGAFSVIRELYPSSGSDGGVAVAVLAGQYGSYGDEDGDEATATIGGASGGADKAGGDLAVSNDFTKLYFVSRGSSKLRAVDLASRTVTTMTVADVCLWWTVVGGGGACEPVTVAAVPNNDETVLVALHNRGGLLKFNVVTGEGSLLIGSDYTDAEGDSMGSVCHVRVPGTKQQVLIETEENVQVVQLNAMQQVLNEHSVGPGE